MKIAIVRGSYLNQAEMQNYLPLTKKYDIKAVSSFFPLDRQCLFETVHLPSPIDLPEQLFVNKKLKMALLNRLFGDAMILVGLGTYFEKEKAKGIPISIAHSAETYFGLTQQCLVAKKNRLVSKIVVTVWENIPFNNENIRLRKSFKKQAFNEVDHFIAVTQRAKNALIKEGCIKEKITVIPMGVDLSRFEPIQSRSKKRKHITKILFVGRLEKEKGIWELLKAYEQLIRNSPFKKKQMELRIVGEGSQHQAILKEIEETGLKKHIKLLSIPYEYIHREYQQADIFVLLSKPTRFWEEQFGMVLVEAMASSLPIITTKTGSIPEVVGKCALIVSTSNIYEIYEAFIKLIKNNNLRRKLASRARKRACRHFNAIDTARKIDAVYMSILNK